MKTIIIGNSGSGKTWLADRIASLTPSPVVHLDDIFWEPGGFNRKRTEEEVNHLIEKSMSAASWIVEGVFGDLAQHYFSDANCLVWMDFDWNICKARLEKRGSESRKHLGREQSAQGLRELIEWASHYDVRTDLRSRSGHEKLFNQFDKNRFLLKSEFSVNTFLKDVHKFIL